MTSARESISKFLEAEGFEGLADSEDVADGVVKQLFADGFLVVRKGNNNHDRSPPTADVGAKTS